ncbi:MAG: hypothetical protein AAFY34_04775 [Pseudomonadota bacterium]
MRFLLVGIICATMAISPAAAEDDDVSALFDCLEIFQNSKRLACYDTATKSLYDDRFPAPAVEQDQSSDDVVATNTETPSQPVSERAQQSAAATRAEPGRYIYKVTKFSYAQNGTITVWLENGDVWRQTDRISTRHHTRDGVAQAELKRGLLGSKWIELDGVTTFKVRQIQ